MNSALNDIYLNRYEDLYNDCGSEIETTSL